MLLTRFSIRRLRFAIFQSPTPPQTAPLPRVGTAAPGLLAPRENRTFFLFNRHCADFPTRATLHHAAETIADLLHALSRLERMCGRPETTCHRFWKMDFRQVAQCRRTETSRPESASVVCGYATQGIHHRNSA